MKEKRKKLEIQTRPAFRDWVRQCAWRHERQGRGKGRVSDTSVYVSTHLYASTHFACSVAFYYLKKSSSALQDIFGCVRACMCARMREYLVPRSDLSRSDLPCAAVCYVFPYPTSYINKISLTSYKLSPLSSVAATALRPLGRGPVQGLGAAVR